MNGVNSYKRVQPIGEQQLETELTSEFEVGLEANFFKNRVGIDFSYYNRYTKDLIEVLPKDPSTGYTSQIGNLWGDVRNQGFELTLNLTPVRLKDFEWRLSWNMSVNKNKVEKLDVDEVFLGGYGGAGIYAVEGKALDSSRFTGAESHGGWKGMHRGGWCGYASRKRGPGILRQGHQRKSTAWV